MNENSIEVIGTYNILGHRFPMYDSYDSPLFNAVDIAVLFGGYTSKGRTNTSLFIQKVPDKMKLKKHIGGNHVKSWMVTLDGLLYNGALVKTKIRRIYNE